MQPLYFFCIPSTMGSIWRQSTQVIAKNSIKIRSFCLETKAFLGVGVEGTAVGIAVADARVAGGGTFDFSCGAAQEEKNKVIKRRKMQRFIRTLARGYIIYITTWVRIN